MQVDKRNIGLDILRAAAILGVFICHGVTLTHAGRDLLGPLGSGVELFFVLSGFLIGRIYFRSSAGSFSFWQFWRSRWWRTLPPYFAAILVYLAVSKFFPAPPLHWYYALFLQNYIGITGFGPSWSLCVEEHFYLLLPIVALAADRIAGRQRLRYLLPLAIFLPLLLRLLTLAFIKPLPAQSYWLSHLHCDGLITGVYLAYLFVEDQAAFIRVKSLAKWLLPIVPLTAIALIVWLHRPPLADMFVNTLYAVGYGAWVRYLYDIRWTPVSSPGRFMRWSAQGIALCSYSIYLTHTTFDPAIRNHVLGSVHRGLAKSLVVLSCTFVLGVVFYFLVERPTIISRDRFLKRSPKPAVDSRQPIALPQEGV